MQLIVGKKYLEEISLAMANTPLNYDLKEISQAYYELAKKWYRYGISFKFLVFFIGLGSVLLAVFPTYAPFLAAILEITAEICLWRSDGVKDVAEVWRRKLDARDSFGWQISSAELSDLLMKTPEKLKKLVPRETQGEEYFASKIPLGKAKALDNIQESAWWSKHLSEKIFQYSLIVSILIFSIALFTLIICIQSINNNDIILSISRIVTSTLMLFFTIGLFRRVIGHYEFSQKASQIELTIEALKKQNFSESDAIKIMHEYQLARSHSPLIPSFIWKKMRRKLNEMWRQYRQ